MRQERRKYTRIEEEFKVEYEIVELDDSLPVKYDLLSSPKLKYKGSTKDISEKGICLEEINLKRLLVSVVTEGTELRLKISIHPGDTINAIGKVVWKNTEKGICGLEFVSIFYKDSLKIHNYVVDTVNKYSEA
ncbi:PilZ domain-containing protein [bacterium]|nr:PilZ domain-containing protein [bacterium]